jgi:hypothetical protein
VVSITQPPKEFAAPGAVLGGAGDRQPGRMLADIGRLRNGSEIAAKGVE